jgi:REP element-mobilizing transposase RayT
MPRKARIDYPGGVHHLIVRGIERKQIFRDDQDLNSFLDRLGSLLLESKTSCFAWALLPNHVHLLVRTGVIPLAGLMRRLLTGYAVTYNRRYRRHGILFQNRYKSILCQEDPYLLELARYIHLNPLRAKMVGSVEALDRYPYTGHSAIMGLWKREWQDVDTVLAYFGQRKKGARRKYREYVGEGVRRGRRPDLVGGGLIRSLGGWEGIQALGKWRGRFKGDERILGKSEFVGKVLKESEEAMERGYELRARGFDLGRIIRRVGEIFGMTGEEMKIGGKDQRSVAARSVVSYWAVKELGVSGTEVARRLRVTQPAVSQAVKRGAMIIEERHLKLKEE